jgi:hypothetical protein
MADHRHGARTEVHVAHRGEPVGASRAEDADQFDRDIHLRPILWTAAGLVIVGVLAALAMWGLFLGVRKVEQGQDRPLSPLPEARQRQLPPEPRLQADPSLDMQEFRTVEERLLTRPEWVDRQRGTVRIPIDLAMDVLARQGLPTTAPAADAAVPGQTAGAADLGRTEAGARPAEQVPGQTAPGRSAPGRPAPGQQPPPEREHGDPEPAQPPPGGLLP